MPINLGPIGQSPAIEAQYVARLRALEDWIQSRTDSIAKLYDFEDVLPVFLKERTPIYGNFLRGLTQLTRAYTADGIVYSRVRYYGDDVADLERFSIFICHKPIPDIKNRSGISSGVVRTLMGNVFCPLQLYDERSGECSMKNKVDKIANDALREAVIDDFMRYRELLKYWCKGPFVHGAVFKYDKLMRERLQSDREHATQKVQDLQESVQEIEVPARLLARAFLMHELGAESIAEHASNDALRRALILGQQTASASKLSELTEQIWYFSGGGLLYREVAATV